jgi:hypothetical protein
MDQRRRPPAGPETQPFDEADLPDGYVTLGQPTQHVIARSLTQGRSGRLYRYQTPGKERRAIEQRYGNNPTETT